MRGDRLQIGERGEIGYRADGDRVLASVYYRDHAGRRRRIAARGESKAAAKRRVLTLLDRALSSGGLGGEYSPRTTFAHVAEDWFRQVSDLVAIGRRSPATAAQYRDILDRLVIPELGSLLLRELTTARVDQFILRTRRDRGYSTAKLCRSVASGVCGVAVRRDAIRVNPVRDVSRLENEEKEVRALTAAECVEWLAILEASAFACRMDLPDLTRFLLGTGVRVGEALGLCWDDVDLAEGVVEIRRTVFRVTGQGMVVKPPKTRTGRRVLRLPSWLAVTLRQRAEACGGSGPVFPDSLGGFRDRNNVEAAYRRVRAGTPFEWVIPHTYRKTVATLLDEGGLSTRKVSDQLGHSRISMTQDVYMGRKAVDPAVAAALEGLWSEDDDDPPAGVAVNR